MHDVSSELPLGGGPVTSDAPRPIDPVTGAQRRPVTWPRAGEWLVRQPLAAGDVTLRSGFWAHRMLINEATSLAVGLGRLRSEGNLDNFQIAAGRRPGQFRGRSFADTDVYKWLEALSWMLQRSPSEHWDQIADDVIATVAAAQSADGYLNTNVTINQIERWSDLGEGHELYCAGHLFQAAVAHHRATGKTTLLRIAERFADLAVAEFGVDGVRAGYCGHPEVETALIELYRETGTRSYLDLAARMLELRGTGLLGPHPFGPAYFQDELAVRDTHIIRGHAVRALYLASGVTDLYLETGEELLLACLTDQWSDMIDGKTYITGGTGSRHRDEAFGDRYELPSDRAYTETCAAVASLHWSWRMLLATGQARYADLFERTLLNGFLSGVSLDGRRFLYVNPLHSRADGTSVPKTRQDWYDCACCPPNVMRMLAALPHYLVTRGDAGLQVHQYAAMSTRTVLADGTTAGFDIATRYPLEGRIELEVPVDCAGTWTLSLRIPGWAAGATLYVADERVDSTPGEYATIARTWRGGELVVLELPMAPRLVIGDPRIDAVRGAAAIERGPFVYCFEGRDQSVDIEQLTIVGPPWPGPAQTELGGLPTVGVAAVAAVGESGWPYRSVSAVDSIGELEGASVRLSAIPYYAWANRSSGPMRVWLPVAPEVAQGGPIAD